MHHIRKQVAPFIVFLRMHTVASGELKYIVDNLLQISTQAILVHVHLKKMT